MVVVAGPHPQPIGVDRPRQTLANHPGPRSVALVRLGKAAKARRDATGKTQGEQGGEIHPTGPITDGLLGIPIWVGDGARRFDSLGEPTPARRIDQPAVTPIRYARLMIVDATPKVLMRGIAFGEQPRWHDGRLWFSDWGLAR